jgi:hypothetical protein
VKNAENPKRENRVLFLIVDEDARIIRLKSIVITPKPTFGFDIAQVSILPPTGGLPKMDYPGGIIRWILRGLNLLRP